MTRAQITFANATGTPWERTIVRELMGGPKAVLPDLLAFLVATPTTSDPARAFIAWSRTHQRVVPVTGASLGLRHINFYYVVEHQQDYATVAVYRVRSNKVAERIATVAVPQPLFSSAPSAHPMELPRVRLNGIWYVRDDRLHEFRRCDNPYERITFDELLDTA